MIVERQRTSMLLRPDAYHIVQVTSPHLNTDRRQWLHRNQCSTNKTTEHVTKIKENCTIGWLLFCWISNCSQCYVRNLVPETLRRSSKRYRTTKTLTAAAAIMAIICRVDQKLTRSKFVSTMLRSRYSSAANSFCVWDDLWRLLRILSTASYDTYAISLEWRCNINNLPYYEVILVVIPILWRYTHTMRTVTFSSTSILIAARLGMHLSS